jgi:DnaJ-class molecular chaperone
VKFWEQHADFEDLTESAKQLVKNNVCPECRGEGTRYIGSNDEICSRCDGTGKRFNSRRMDFKCGEQSE